jgi:hypothetical protein
MWPKFWIFRWKLEPWEITATMATVQVLSITTLPTPIRYNPPSASSSARISRASFFKHFWASLKVLNVCYLRTSSFWSSHTSSCWPSIFELPPPFFSPHLFVFFARQAHYCWTGKGCQVARWRHIWRRWSRCRRWRRNGGTPQSRSQGMEGIYWTMSIVVVSSTFTSRNKIIMPFLAFHTSVIRLYPSKLR